MPSLVDELEDLETETGSAKETVGTNPGPLPEPELSSVDNDLADAQERIKSALVIIGSVGSVDTTLPTTLPAIADRCHTLAEDAHRESTETSPDNAFIGDCIKTIDWLIDVEAGYRDKAGIT